jgi:hypothetical protein
VTIFTSIEAKPKIAFVGTPREVAIDSGSAKNARYTRLGPSIKNTRVSFAGAAAGLAAVALARVVSLAIDRSLYEARARPVGERAPARSFRAAAERTRT